VCSEEELLLRKEFRHQRRRTRIRSRQTWSQRSLNIKVLLLRFRFARRILLQSWSEICGTIRVRRAVGRNDRDESIFWQSHQFICCTWYIDREAQPFTRKHSLSQSSDIAAPNGKCPNEGKNGVSQSRRPPNRGRWMARLEVLTSRQLSLMQWWNKH